METNMALMNESATSQMTAQGATPSGRHAMTERPIPLTDIGDDVTQ
jgi:hypothetical protein